MPPRTGIESYHSGILRNVNGDYLGGRFSWTCSSCLNITDASNQKSLPDRLAVLESILFKNAMFYRCQYESLKTTLDEMQAQMKALVSQSSSIQPSGSVCDDQYFTTHDCLPPKESSRPSYASMTKPDQLQGPPQVRCSQTAGNHTPPVQSSGNDLHENTRNQLGTTVSSANYRIRLEKEESDKPLIKILEQLAMANKIKDYDYRAKGKNATDLLFKAADDCHRAHNDLLKVFEQEEGTKVSVNTPELMSPKKTYFVGIPAGVDKESLHTKIADMYPDLRLDSVNKCSMKIFDPKPCLKDKHTLRSTVFLSEELYSFFTKKLGSRVSLGNYTRLGVYDCISRCLKCQSFEHSFERCRKKGSVCATCGGNHYTRKCPHPDDREKWSCANCAHSPAHKDGCKSHRASDSCCPVYKDFQQRHN